MESAVYLLALSEQAGPFKIGLADSAAQRAGAVVGAPFDQLAGESSVAFFPSRAIAARVERLMHAVFAPHRLAAGPFARTGSSEWFARQAFDPARALLTSQATILGGRLVPFRDVLPTPKPKPPPRSRSRTAKGRFFGPNAFKKNPVIFPCPPWFYVRNLQRAVWELREHLIYFDGTSCSLEMIVAVSREHPSFQRLERYRSPASCTIYSHKGALSYFRAEHLAGRDLGQHTEASGPRSAFRWQRFTERFYHGYQRWDAQWTPSLSRFFDSARTYGDDPFFNMNCLVRLAPHWL